jgi:4-hydroxythreonine-4-phosphate dehydrogenase
MSNELQKPIIGFTCGDLNGIGIELIIRSLHDNRILEICTPIVFVSNKSINFYRKSLTDINFSYSSCKDFQRINPKQVNIFNCWEEEVQITPGELNETGGKYALISLTRATQALKNADIDALVTAPIHKKNIYSDSFKFNGHTPYLKHFFEAKDVVMLMVANNMKVGLVTEHIAIADVAKHITKELILSKLQLINACLQTDFGIEKPRIAVLGLNPHTGDEGLIGDEEDKIIKPAIKEAKQNILAFGPYSADAFFTRGQHEKFDAVLAMYHDQGLIPFKSLALGEGVNYTAGLNVIRTSPDHGTAFDIAGKGKADHLSFLEAIFLATDIVRTRKEYAENRKNPIKKVSAKIIANAIDERIEE